MWVARCFAAAWLALVAPGCSLLGLDHFTVPTCTLDRDCAVYNSGDATAGDPCHAYFCDVPTGRCALGTIDADHDGDRPLACGGTDCDDTRGTRAGILTEQPDAVDNDCDSAIDEDAIGVEVGATTEVDSLPASHGIRYTSSFGPSVGFAVLSNDTSLRYTANLGSFGAASSRLAPIAIANCPSGACDIEDVGIDFAQVGFSLALLSGTGCRRIGPATTATSGTSVGATLAWLSPATCSAGLPELAAPRLAHDDADPMHGLMAWQQQTAGSDTSVMVSGLGGSTMGPTASLGSATALGAPADVAAIGGDGFVVAFASSGGLVARIVGRGALPSLAGDAASHILLAQGATSTRLRLAAGRTNAAGRTSLGVSFIDGGHVWFAAVGLGGTSAASGSAVMLADSSGSGDIAVAYQSEGYVLDGYTRSGGTATATTHGGWIVAWSDDAGIGVRRVLELDGQPLDSTAARIDSASLADPVFFGSGVPTCAIRLAYRVTSGAEHIDSHGLECVR